MVTTTSCMMIVWMNTTENEYIIRIGCIMLKINVTAEWNDSHCIVNVARIFLVGNTRYWMITRGSLFWMITSYNKARVSKKICNAIIPSLLLFNLKKSRARKRRLKSAAKRGECVLHGWVSIFLRAATPDAENKKLKTKNVYFCGRTGVALRHRKPCNATSPSLLLFIQFSLNKSQTRKGAVDDSFCSNKVSPSVQSCASPVQVHV